MDPNANLQEQEQLITSHESLRKIGARLTELRQALYDWIRDGGFEPDWSKAPQAAKYYGR